MGGQLDKESVDYDPRGPALKFRLQNEDGSLKLPVVFNDIMPDNLMKSTEIVVTWVCCGESSLWSKILQDEGRRDHE